VTADGAYDGAPTYATIAAHGDDIEVVIPPARLRYSVMNWVRSHSVTGILK